MTAPDAASEFLSLRELRLRPGMFLQALPASGRGRPTEAKFCAALDGKGLMVVPLHEGAPGAEWRDQSPLQVSGFTGQIDFRFPTRVLGSFSVPFAYVLLAWPEQVEARRVRKALRIATSLQTLAWGRDPGSTVPARVLDLSHAGAMLELASPLGVKGDRVSIALELPLDGGIPALQLSGPICHCSPGGAGPDTRIGMAFEGLSRTDKALLQNFTLSQLAAQGVIS